MRSVLVALGFAVAFGSGIFVGRIDRDDTREVRDSTAVGPPFAASSVGVTNVPSASGTLVHTGDKIAPRSAAELQAWRERMLALGRERPAEAIAEVLATLGEQRGAQLVSALVESWATDRPLEAWNWVRANLRNADIYEATMIEWAARGSTVGGRILFDAYLKQHPEHSLTATFTFLSGVAHRGQFGEIQSLAAQLTKPGTEERAAAYNLVASLTAEYDPAGAIAWARGLPDGEEKARAISGLSGMLAMQDPAKAAEFARTLPAGEMRNDAMETAVAQWLQRSPEEARAWVAKANAYEDYDAAVRVLATQGNIMQRSPADAMQIASGIYDTTVRETTMRRILQAWAGNDPDTAQQFLSQTAELAPETKSRWTQELFPR